MILCLASFCWSYNTQIYFDLYYPGYDIAIPMMLCSLIGGSIGIATGGIISDLVVSKYGIYRLFVEVNCDIFCLYLFLCISIIIGQI